MARRPDLYVALYRDYDGSWVTRTTVSSDPPEDFTTMIEVYLVEGVTRPSAIPVVMEWLARGRPSHMSVRSMWQSGPMTVAS